MASEHEEVDPIKSNPTSHKAIGVVGMVAFLVGLSYWLTPGRTPGNLPVVAVDAGGIMADGDTACCPPTECPDAASAEDPGTK